MIVKKSVTTIIKFKGKKVALKINRSLRQAIVNSLLKKGYL